jgi:hypothetical protein
MTKPAVSPASFGVAKNPMKQFCRLFKLTLNWSAVLNNSLLFNDWFGCVVIHYWISLNDRFSRLSDRSLKNFVCLFQAGTVLSQLNEQNRS